MIQTEPQRTTEHLNFWFERLVEPSFVYVIQGDPETPIKIGRAIDPKRRLRELQTANPQHLRLLAVLPGGAGLESALHERMRPAHIAHNTPEATVYTEWFRWGHDAVALLVLIEALNEQMMAEYDGTGRVPLPPLLHEVVEDRPDDRTPGRIQLRA